MAADPTSWSMDECSTVFRAIRFRPRRAHEKSRAGCARCKQQRKKCDEVKPSCSRCAARNYRCKYPTSSPGPQVADEQHDEKPTSRLGVLGSHLPSLTISSPTSPFEYPDSLASTSSTSAYGSLSPGPSFHERKQGQPYSAPTDTLDSMELGLLSHYLSYTSQVIPFDEDDLYALRVGIPNLAFASKPVMNSLLALAAACKCYVTIKHSSAPLENRERICALLSFADRHYRASLEQIQAAIHTTDCYDHVLANAALMVLYCTASHSVRVRLMEVARRSDDPLPNELMPTGPSQWISLIRAAHAAHAGLLHGSNGLSGATIVRAIGSDNNIPDLSEHTEFSPEDGPSEDTRRLFFPIVAATCGPALERLRTKAQYIATTETTQASVTPPTEDYYDWEQSSGRNNSEIQICFTALDTLSDVAEAVIAAKDPSPESSQEPIFDYEVSPLGHLRDVSPWLRRYLARVTSAVPSKPLRRTVMPFVNRVPLEYLTLVQSILDIIPPNLDHGSSPAAETMACDSFPPNATHLLAMDIFAHWLVLVILLDGVWWIGGIGEWELGRVVSFMRNHEGFDLSIPTGETWWPEEMLRVKRSLQMM